MIKRMLESIVERSKSPNDNDEVVEKGFFVFEASEESEESIVVPYELRAGDNFEEERDKAAATVFGDTRGVN